MVNNKGLIVTVVGLGYIGLPTAALIASKKIQVHGVDVNPTIVDQVNQGQAHFQEPERKRKARVRFHGDFFMIFEGM